MNLDHGVLTISLDFELYWGVRDKRAIEAYRANLEGVWKAVPALLDCFESFGIHATWAAVGMLYCRDRADLMAALPEVLPGYHDTNLSPYPYVQAAESLETPLHFAPSLLDAIRARPGQEVGTHTYSHYYCLEAGASVISFRADLAAAKARAEAAGDPFLSLVFPRNQVDPDWLAELTKAGILAYRGTESGWMYRAVRPRIPTPLVRIARLLDAYVDLSGPNTYDLEACARSMPYDLPSSRFLRPFDPRLAFLDGLRLRRIIRAMNHAARHHRLFHLWWHPHNFGRNLDENLAFLRRILEHYVHLNRTHGMRSLSMGEVARILGS